MSEVGPSEFLIVDSLKKFADDGWVGEADALHAIEAHLGGDPGHSIGFELEVLKSASDEIHGEIDPNERNLYLEAIARLTDYRFKIADDGVYEIISPASLHPEALYMASLGLANMGWLPDETFGVVNAHISIGTNSEIDRLNRVQELARILRSVEMIGGATPRRLSIPLRKALYHNEPFVDNSWACKGIAGLCLGEKEEHIQLCSTGSWEGDLRNRIEFRTLGYYSPEQFRGTLEKVYYLTRGMFAHPNSKLGRAYKSFNNDLKDYFVDNDLPDVDEHSVGLAYSHDPLVSIGEFSRYMMPFIEKMLEGDEDPGAIGGLELLIDDTVFELKQAV